MPALQGGGGGHSRRFGFARPRLLLFDSSHDRRAVDGRRHRRVSDLPEETPRMDCGRCSSAGPVPTTFPGAVLRRAALPLLLLFFPLSLRSAESRPITAVEHSADLDALLSRVAGDVVQEFAAKGLNADGLSISVVAVSLNTEGAALAAGSYRGEVAYYPASIVKAFYLAYYESRKEAGSLTDTPELARAVHDMITVSSNDATGFVVDSITDTTSGPEIATQRKWKKWMEKRNAVNRFFAARGYRDLNANQKTFCEDAYGREQAFRDGGENRNRMTTDSVARLFREIALDELASPTGTAEMLGLLSRDVTSEKPLEDFELEDARL